MMKVCKGCDNQHPLTNFYTHKAMRDGYLSHCKACVKQRVHKHRINNIERIREYDRHRSLLEHRRQKHLRYTKDPKRQLQHSEAKKRWAHKNAIKRAAHNLVNAAVRDGKLIKPPVCDVCRKHHDRIHGHHEDYYRPLDVVWMCPLCHGDRHREINRTHRKTHEVAL